MKIDIENLEFKCIIGILDFERVKKQKVIINLSFDYDFGKDNFIDYSKSRIPIIHLKVSCSISIFISLFSLHLLKVL